MNQLVLHSVSYAGLWPGQERLSLEEFIPRARTLGYEGVEIVAKRPHLSPIEIPPERRRRLRELCQEHGVEVACLAGYTDFTANAEHPDIPLVEMQALYLRELATIAEHLGCRRIRVFTGFSHPSLSPDAAWARCVTGLAESARLVAEHGVTLVVQNHHDVAVHSTAMAQLLADVGEPNCLAAFDAWAPTLHGDDPVDGVRLLGSRIAFTTVADYVRRPRFRYRPELVNYERDVDQIVAVPFGEGIIDYPAFFRALAAVGYDGPISYELCSPLRGGGSLTNLDSYARRFVESARSMIGL